MYAIDFVRNKSYLILSHLYSGNGGISVNLMKISII